tara:strand:- start:239153 stop:239467 length:315 start_codon:yes stop_codon:yes gene_type:complete
MNFGIENKIALIIGSDSGIGLATAKTLAAEGCTLILSSRSEEKLKLAKQEISKVNDQAAVYYHVCDIIKNAEVEALDIQTVILGELILLSIQWEPEELRAIFWS